MSSELDRFERAARERTLEVGVVGLGYVGLPAALLIAEAGFQVTGVDRVADRMALLSEGRSPIEGNEPGLGELLSRCHEAGRIRFTVDVAALSRADVVLVAVETPVEADHRPRYDALRAALASLAPVLKRDALLVVESTLAPGTIDRIVVPLLAAAGRGDVLVGHCPERVMPGKLLSNMKSLSRVCGGATPEASARMIAFYRTFVAGSLTAASAVTAELTKTAENAYRDVNIAFANELALICEDVGADFAEVRRLVNESPGRNVLLAGTGVGGHCIPKDPWLLLSALPSSERGASEAGVIEAARVLNDAMPERLAARVGQALSQRGVSIEGAEVAVLGWAYLENSDDARNTPSAALQAALERLGARVRVHDPFVAPAGAVARLEDALTGADAAVLAVAHRAYVEADWASLGARMRGRLVVDGRDVLRHRAVWPARLELVTLGVGGLAAT